MFCAKYDNGAVAKEAFCSVRLSKARMSRIDSVTSWSTDVSSEWNSFSKTVKESAKATRLIEASIEVDYGSEQLHEAPKVDGIYEYQYGKTGRFVEFEYVENSNTDDVYEVSSQLEPSERAYSDTVERDDSGTSPRDNLSSASFSSSKEHLSNYTDEDNNTQSNTTQISDSVISQQQQQPMVKLLDGPITQDTGVCFEISSKGTQDNPASQMMNTRQSQLENTSESSAMTACVSKVINVQKAITAKASFSSMDSGHGSLKPVKSLDANELDYSHHHQPLQKSYSAYDSRVSSQHSLYESSDLWMPRNSEEGEFSGHRSDFTTGDILKSVWSHKTQLITKKKKILSNLFSCRHPNKEIEIDDKVTMPPRCEIDDRLSTLPLPRVPGTRLQANLHKGFYNVRIAAPSLAPRQGNLGYISETTDTITSEISDTSISITEETSARRNRFFSCCNKIRTQHSYMDPPTELVTDTDAEFPVSMLTTPPRAISAEGEMRNSHDNIRQGEQPSCRYRTRIDAPVLEETALRMGTTNIAHTDERAPCA